MVTFEAVNDICAATQDFQQCGILTIVNLDEPVQLQMMFS